MKAISTVFQSFPLDGWFCTLDLSDEGSGDVLLVTFVSRGLNAVTRLHAGPTNIDPNLQMKARVFADGKIAEARRLHGGTNNNIVEMKSRRYCGHSGPDRATAVFEK